MLKQMNIMSDRLFSCLKAKTLARYCNHVPSCAVQQPVSAYMQTACLNDRSDELNEEAWQLHEGGIEGVEVVHDQALDVRSIMVLICHDHEMAIAQLLHISVHLQIAKMVSRQACRQTSERNAHLRHGRVT